MSAAEWIKQKELERKGIRMQPQSSSTPTPAPTPAPTAASAIIRGIDESIRMQEEARKRNAFIERPDAGQEKPVRLSALPSPEIEKIQAGTPGFYQANGNTYYKSPTGKIHYIPSPRKPSPDEQIFPLFESGNKIVNTMQNKTGTIERFRRIYNNIPYYSVNYDDGTFETFESQSNLLREN
jgi:hypothetical protein